MQHCFFLSRKSLRFLASAMGIAIANRKKRCDFGALRFTSCLPMLKAAPETLALFWNTPFNARLTLRRAFSPIYCWKCLQGYKSLGHLQNRKTPKCRKLERNWQNKDENLATNWSSYVVACFFSYLLDFGGYSVDVQTIGEKQANTRKK